MSLTIAGIANYLDRYFDSARFKEDQSGIYHPSQRPIKKIGLALEPWQGIGAWVQSEQLDAMFLHRPWKLGERALPRDIGILAYHLAFDLNLTFGLNYRLAQTLQIKHPTAFAMREDIPHGMVGHIQPTSLKAVLSFLKDAFGVPPMVEEMYTDVVQKIAIVGAMTDVLVRQAAEQDVQLYVTGQFRKPAELAVHETQMTVAVIGHTTGELWGLRALAGLLRERWAQLEVIIAPNK